MIDANSQFFAILTNVGMAKLANANALGIPWKITEMGLGDANNTDPIPSVLQTKLINEWRRRPLNQLRIDPVNPAVIIAEQVIPADEGGRWIREIGLYDADGDMVAVANCAPSFKPVLSQGSGRTQVVRMNFIVTSTGNITLKIDPAVVLATREYVDTRILDELNKLDNKQSVRVATTSNIALAGLLSVDSVALVAGDRVLVKNQNSAKDNGLYIAAAGAWPRAADADSNTEVTSALLVSVEQGAAQADTHWQLITDGVIVLGTTALIFQDVTQGFAPINSPALTGTPTAPNPARFDDSQQLVTTDWVKSRGLELSGFFGVGASQAIPVTYVGGLINLNGPAAFTLTLPAASKVVAGATLSFINTNIGVVSFASSGIDFLSAPDGSSAVGLKMLQGDSLTLTATTQGWVVSGGSMALKYSKGQFGYSSTNAGYFKLPSGQIFQWTTATYDYQVAGGAKVTVRVTWPIAFTVAHLGSVVCLAGGNYGTGGVIYSEDYSLNGCQVTMSSLPGNANWAYATCMIFAIGV